MLSSSTSIQSRTSVLAVGVCVMDMQTRAIFKTRRILRSCCAGVSTTRAAHSALHVVQGSSRRPGVSPKLIRSLNVNVSVSVFSNTLVASLKYLCFQ